MVRGGGGLGGGTAIGTRAEGGGYMGDLWGMLGGYRHWDPPISPIWGIPSQRHQSPLVPNPAPPTITHYPPTPFRSLPVPPHYPPSPHYPPILSHCLLPPHCPPITPPSPHYPQLPPIPLPSPPISPPNYLPSPPISPPAAPPHYPVPVSCSPPSAGRGRSRRACSRAAPAGIGSAHSAPLGSH